jgi:ketosteroid isomerase-like protein
MKTTMVAALAAGICMAGFGALAAADPKDELVALEASWSKAIVANDSAAVGRILADDWTGQNPSGKVTTKAKALADMKSGDNKSTSMTNHDVRVRIIGDVAIVQGMDDEKSTSKGKDVSGTYIWTDVFQKRSGHWVAVASQGSPVKAEK